MQEYSKETGATIEFSSNVDGTIKGADVIYTDIWVSMGEDESLYPERVKLLTPYKVTREMMNKTGNKNTLFMHCLPSFHDEDTEVCKVLFREQTKLRLTLAIRTRKSSRYADKKITLHLKVNTKTPTTSSAPIPEA